MKLNRNIGFLRNLQRICIIQDQADGGHERVSNLGGDWTLADRQQEKVDATSSLHEFRGTFRALGIQGMEIFIWKILSSEKAFQINLAAFYSEPFLCLSAGPLPQSVWAEAELFWPRRHQMGTIYWTIGALWDEMLELENRTGLCQVVGPAILDGAQYIWKCRTSEVAVKWENG